MNTFHKISEKRGFTILELLVVLAIIGLLAAIILWSISDSREKGRDAGRKSQTQEILKALELYYSDNNVYPSQLTGTEGPLSEIQGFFGPGNYLSRMPDEASSRYYYCVSPDGKAILLALDTEDDKNGSPWCNITRSGPVYGCDAWQSANATDRCATRF